MNLIVTYFQIVVHSGRPCSLQGDYLCPDRVGKREVFLALGLLLEFIQVQRRIGSLLLYWPGREYRVWGVWSRFNFETNDSHIRIWCRWHFNNDIKVVVKKEPLARIPSWLCDELKSSNRHSVIVIDLYGFRDWISNNDRSRQSIKIKLIAHSILYCFYEIIVFKLGETPLAGLILASIGVHRVIHRVLEEWLLKFCVIHGHTLDLFLLLQLVCWRWTKVEWVEILPSGRERRVKLANKDVEKLLWLIRMRLYVTKEKRAFSHRCEYEK